MKLKLFWAVRNEVNDLDKSIPLANVKTVDQYVTSSISQRRYRQSDSNFESTRGTANAQNPAYRSRVSVHEMLVGGSDSAGREMAVALRKSVGVKAVLSDFKRYGFGQRTSPPVGEMFWGELAPTWQHRLNPGSAYVLLTDKVDGEEWANVLSIGEDKLSVTALHVSRFLQAVGNDGVMLVPTAREEQSTSIAMNPSPSHRDLKKSSRVMRESTALRLQSAMRDTVERGTAKSIADVFENTGWQIGGKTGTGPALMPKRSEPDGWFAGLIFDAQGKARFTVATFVRGAGAGGGNAAKTSAALGKYVVGAETAISR